MVMHSVALIYDFDGTLARGNLQERSFIPDIGMTNDAFWAEVHEKARAADADQILIYMQLMLEKAKEKGVDITESAFMHHGATAELFPGLADQSWFEKIGAFGAQHGLLVEHYIVSSGIFEMIRGCPIFPRFKHVFASKFVYDGEGRAIWPGVSINYTTKTQYCFRINKGVLNQWDDKPVNAYMQEDQRPVPFDRMIYFGDGLTDIPTMKMMTYKGGYSIAVYDKESNAAGRAQIHQLLADDRVNFIAPADYTEDSQLDIIVKGLLGRMQRRLEEAGGASA